MAKKHPSLNVRFSLGGHRSITAFICAALLFVSVCVYFVNAVVISTTDDPTYRSTAEGKTSSTSFDTSVLQKAQEFSANASNTTLPAGRINPFAQ